MAAFGDMSLLHQNDPRILMRFITSLVNLGYETIAINRIFTPETNPKRIAEKIPQPPDLTKLPGLDDVKRICPRLKLLARITVVVDHHSQMRYLPGEPVQSYDIVGVRPTNEKLFQQICQTVEADVISFDMSSRLPFFIKHPQVKLATERGMSFEITYAPAIRDESLRKNVISNALELIRVCKGKNLVMSSEAESLMELRGPYDLVNLGLLFGLKQDQSKATISKNVRSMIFHAEARNRTVKGLFSLERISPSETCLKRTHEKVESEKEENNMVKKMKV